MNSSKKTLDKRRAPCYSHSRIMIPVICGVRIFRIILIAAVVRAAYHSFFLNRAPQRMNVRCGVLFSGENRSKQGKTFGPGISVGILRGTSFFCIMI